MNCKPISAKKAKIMSNKFLLCLETDYGSITTLAYEAARTDLKLAIHPELLPSSVGIS